MLQLGMCNTNIPFFILRYFVLIANLAMVGLVVFLAVGFLVVWFMMGEDFGKSMDMAFDKILSGKWIHPIWVPLMAFALASIVILPFSIRFNSKRNRMVSCSTLSVICICTPILLSI